MEDKQENNHPEQEDKNMVPPIPGHPKDSTPVDDKSAGGEHSRFMPPGGQMPSVPPTPKTDPKPDPVGVTPGVPESKQPEETQPAAAPAPQSVPNPEVPPTAERTSESTASATPPPAGAPSYAAPAGFKTRIGLEGLRRAVDQINNQLHSIIIGQHQMTDLMIIAILADGHVLIEGVPGVAKTLTSKLLARAIDVEFQRIQFTPDLMPSDVVGTSIFNQKDSEFEFKPGPIFSNLVLIDEINRAPAKTQSALFEAMEERQVTVDGTTYELSEPFMVLATQNPVEQEGTYRLPEAQLDRFLFKIEVHYPQLQDEQRLLKNFHEQKNAIDFSKVSKVLNASKIKEYRDKVALVHIDDNLINYIASIVNNTRDNLNLFLGASPRASISILSAAKATAAIRGREFVTPDDIKFVAPSVLKHRIILTPEKEMEGLTPDEVVKQILEFVEVPR